MSSSLSFGKSPKSATRKLPLLPRFGFFIDIGGRQLSYRKVPLLETLANMIEDKNVGMKGLIETTRTMMREVRLSGFETQNLCESEEKPDVAPAAEAEATSI
jgi:hypothetical protein